MREDKVKQIIEETARATVKEALEGRMDGAINYYRAMESLLFNYKKLAALVEDEAAYLEVEWQGKSSSFVAAKLDGQSRRDMDEIMESMARQKQISFNRTKTQFEDVNRVVRLFADRKEFVVVRMYYFNEDPHGHDRGPDAKRYTWGEIAEELDALGILRDEKSARRWKSRIVENMAVCMFGKAAAISVQASKPDMRVKMPESCPNGALAMPE